MKYKCIKDFLLDEYDDNGAFAEKQILCKKDSIWETDEIANRFIGDKETVRLIEINNKDSFRWIEISKETLDECFECGADSSKLKGEIKLGQHTTNKDDYWIYDDNGLICGSLGINENKVNDLIKKLNNVNEALEKQVPYKLTQIDKGNLTGVCKCGRVTDVIDCEHYCKYCGQKVTK